MGKFREELIESMQQAAAHAGGRKVPDAPAAAYLLAIQRRPKEVMEAVRDFSASDGLSREDSHGRRKCRRR